VSIHYSSYVRSARLHSYREGAEVVQPGDIVVQGDTVVLWEVQQPKPLRLHFFGEDLERIEVKQEEGWVKTSLDLTEEPCPNEVPTEHGTIHPGEYLVHPTHGVGIFQYRETREVGGELRHFISLEYAGNDTLLYPWERAHELMPYIGSRQPKLTRLYSKAWERLKERVQKDLIGIARGLIKLYVARQRSTREVYVASGQFVQEIAGFDGFSLT